MGVTACCAPYYGYAGEGTMRTSITSSLIGREAVAVFTSSAIQKHRKVEVTVESGAFSGENTQSRPMRVQTAILL